MLIENKILPKSISDLYEDLIDSANNTDDKNRDIKIESVTAGGWSGFTDKYWLTALIPNQKEKVNFRYRISKRRL